MISDIVSTISRSACFVPLLCPFLNSSATAYELHELWAIEHIFSMPESAVIDAERNAIYVSNVNVYAKDGNGFISRVNLDGITADGCGGYLYTLLDDARIHRITSSGLTYAVSATAYDDIDLQLVGNIMAIPRVGDSLSLIEVNTDNCMPD